VKFFAAHLRYLIRMMKTLHFLFLFNGVLLASVFFFATEAVYEKELFGAISKNIKESLPQNHTVYDFALKALHTTSYLQDHRLEIFGSHQLSGLKASVFHTSTTDLMTNNGACGSYVTVLARILKSNNIKIRIGQMKANGVYGTHMFVEAWLHNKWVVMDPTYALHFVNPDGSWATFPEIQSNWDYFKTQLPAGYKEEYRYESVRYTNWDKIPVVTTFIKSALNQFIGKEKADSISIRPYLLRIDHKLAWFCFVMWVITALYTLKRYRIIKKQRIKMGLLNNLSAKTM
jgi:Transglutaminase-like superfamily